MNVVSREYGKKGPGEHHELNNLPVYCSEECIILELDWGKELDYLEMKLQLCLVSIERPE